MRGIERHRTCIGGVRLRTRVRNGAGGDARSPNIGDVRGMYRYNNNE